MRSVRSRSIDGAAIRAVVAAARPSAALVGAVGLLFIASALVNAYTPYATGRIIDDLQHQTAPAHDLIVYAGILLAYATLSSCCSYASTSLGQRFVRNLRVAVADRVHRARIDGLSARTFGEVANRMTNDPNALGSQLQTALFPQIQNLLTLAATVTAIVLIDPWMALVSVVLLLLNAVPTSIAWPYMAVIARELASAMDVLVNVIQETCTLSAATLLRNANARPREVERIRTLSDVIVKHSMRQARLASIMTVALTITQMTGPLAILTLGAIFVDRHILTTGSLVALMMYQMRMYAPFTSLSGIQSQLATMSVSASRICELLDLEPEIGGSLPAEGGAIDMRGVVVDFGNRRILDALNVGIGEREHVALVGPSGVGKSTVGSLLTRLVEHRDGRILMGGADLAAYDLAALRHAIVVVPQDAFLFDVSLYDNLRYFNHAASDAELAYAVETCRLQPVIARFAGGLDERVGQRGSRLSGGERQRICLARALLAKPRLLIMDEALSGVDAQTEYDIITDLRAQLADRSLVMITHRLSAIRGFDRILVMENGGTVVEGREHDVLSRSSWLRSNLSPEGAPR